MAVDFGILERTPTIGSRFMEGQQAAQQQAERNMLRQMQMQQMAIQQENMLAQRENMAAQREERAAHAEERRARIAQAQAAEARLEQLAQSVGQPITEESLRKMQADALRSGNPAAVTLIGNIAKDYQTAQEGRRVAALFGPQEMPTGAPTVAPAAPAEAPANALAAPAAMPAAAPAAMPTAPAVAAAPPALGARRETVRVGKRDLTEQELLPLLADPNPRVQAAARAALDLMKANKPPTDEAMMTRLGIPLTPEGFARYNALKQQPAGDIQAYNLAVQQGFKGDIFEFKRQLAMAGRAPAQPPQPPQPQPPVAVVDPTTGKTVYVSREEALSGRMTPAASIEGLTPKEKQTREAKYPQATAALKGFELTSDTLIKDLKALAAHPGLGSITGIVAGRAPGITAEGRAAQALYDKVLARGGFQELQAMRQASPTGGALGNVSNQEGAQLKAAFAAVDRRQDAADVRKAITDAIAQIEASKRNVRDAYDLTYEYRQPAGGGATGSWSVVR